MPQPGDLNSSSSSEPQPSSPASWLKYPTSGSVYDLPLCAVFFPSGLDPRPNDSRVYRVFRHVSYEACKVSDPAGLRGYAGREETALGATYVIERASFGWAAEADETMVEILEVGEVCAGGPG